MDCVFGATLLAEGRGMAIDKSKIVTQDELQEPAPMDKAEDRAQKKIAELKSRTKKQVAQGLEMPVSGKGRPRNKKLERTSHRGEV